MVRVWFAYVAVRRTWPAAQWAASVSQACFLARVSTRVQARDDFADLRGFKARAARLAESISVDEEALSQFSQIANQELDDLAQACSDILIGCPACVRLSRRFYRRARRCSVIAVRGEGDLGNA